MKIKHSVKPVAVHRRDERKDGRKISAGEADEKDCRRVITVVGINCMLVEARTKSVVAPS